MLHSAHRRHRQILDRKVRETLAERIKTEGLGVVAKSMLHTPIQQCQEIHTILTPIPA